MAEDTKELTPAQAKKQIETLEAKLATANTALEKAKDALATEVAAHAETREELAIANGLVEEVTQRLENADAIAAESSTHVLTFEKKQYRVLATTVQHKGVKYEAKDLSQHPEVLKDLIGDGKGLVQLIVAAKE
jgi:chromosome segregation ATPase